MEGFSAERARYRAVGADQPEIEPELLCDGQGEGVAASGDEDDFDAGSVRATEGGQIAVGNLELWIEQRAVDVGGYQSDGLRIGLRAPGFGLRLRIRLRALGFEFRQTIGGVAHPFILTHRKVVACRFEPNPASRSPKPLFRSFDVTTVTAYFAPYTVLCGA